VLVNIDKKLEEEILILTRTNDDFWDFKGDDDREHIHGIFTYPAVMVPKMQRLLLDVILRHQTGIHSILDPFVGSGTILTEGMLKGLDVNVIDINPLAILFNKVKSSIYDAETLRQKSIIVKDCIESKKGTLKNSTNFEKMSKWFLDRISDDLAVIKAAIEEENDILYRRFFWAVLCNIIRDVSNSSNNTVKLYETEEKKIKAQEACPISEFYIALDTAVTGLCEFQDCLKTKELIDEENSKYSKTLNVHFGDSKEFLNDVNVFPPESVDLIITSPPYGDNHTTVTYGQFSILQLKWINVEDIGIEVPKNMLEGFSTIDTLSLGGKWLKIDKDHSLFQKSKTLKKQYNGLNKVDEVKANKVISFFYDFDQCLQGVSKALNTNGYVVWTVGNRNVNNEIILFNKILKELSKCYGMKFVYEADRNILRKRTPNMNKTGETMKNEYILILRKKRPYKKNMVIKANRLD
jgi:site-specific DNA-methyltransferase (cytosine-N4-specific)